MGDGPEIYSIVSERVMRLQGAYLEGTSARATALLAALRHAVGRQPGEVPEIWEITMEGLGPARGDAPTAMERACHDALTLYALHQQSRSKAMHVVGYGLGRSVYRLAMEDAGVHVQAVRRRFDAAATSATYEELRHHLRGLIAQLRSRDIATDYGALARDLLDAQWAEGLVTVRRRWARSYYREAASFRQESTPREGAAPSEIPDSEVPREEQ